jgi:hypothetical protein
MKSGMSIFLINNPNCSFSNLHELKDIHDEEHRVALYCTVVVFSGGLFCDM